MKLPRRNFLHLAAGTAALPIASRFACAQAYPSRPMHLIVPFAPAGGADTIARVMGQWLSERLGQPFIIENRPGAGTNIATEAVVRAPSADTHCFGPTQRMRSTRHSTRSSVSISSAILRPLRASRAYPLLSWSVPRFPN